MDEAGEPPLSALTETERKLFDLIMEGTDPRTIGAQRGIEVNPGAESAIAHVLMKMRATWASRMIEAQSASATDADESATRND